MNKKLLKALAITACSLTFAVSAGFGVANTLRGNEPETVTASEIQLDSEWLDDRDHNSLFTVPMGNIDGVRASTFVVESPSGQAYNSEKVLLSEVGKYVVTWFSVIDGEHVSAQKEFQVTKKTIGLSENATLTASNSDEYPFPTKGSVHLTMKEGASFTYNRVVDLSELGVDNSLLIVFPEKGIENIKEATTKSQYNVTEDASVYFITLTDCYDTSNYVTIQMAWLDGNYWTVYGNAVGQKAHSLHRTSNGTLQIGETHRYNLSYEPSIGYRAYNMSQEGLQFFYDNENNRIYVRAERWYAANGTTRLEGYASASKRLVADLSNELIYPGNTFEGFTTGEVYLSITPASFGSTGEANLDIVSIGKDKLSLDMLTNKEKDTTKPVIQSTYDFDTYTMIAKGEEISVPQIVARDTSVSGSIVADAKVYLDYNSTTKKGTKVTVTNGKFTPQVKGLYTIIYTATDPYGNASTKEVTLKCLDTSATAISLALEDTSFEVQAGDRWEVPECTVTGFYADSSNVKVYADGKLLEDNILFAEEIKNYKLTYVYETPFKTYTLERDVQATPSDLVVFSEIYLPEYLIANASYTLDPVTAQGFSEANSAPYAPKTYMKADNGEYTEVNYKNVTIPKASTVQFKYVADNGAFTESEPVKVVDTGFGGELQKKEYFQSEDATTFEKVSTSSNTTYTINSGATMKYVNPLSLSNFKIDFLVSNANSVKFTLVDFYEREKTLTLELRHSTALDDNELVNKMEVFIDGISVKNVTGTTFLDTKTVVEFSNGFEITTGQTLTGPFDWETDFNTDKILVWVTVTNVQTTQTEDEEEEENQTPDITGTPTITVNRFYSNKFTNVTTDDSSPMFWLALNYRGYQVVGKEITLPKIVVTDLYTPFLEGNLTLEVKDPDSNPVTSKDGVLLNGSCAVDRDYKVVLNRLGKFNVRFNYVENGVKTPYAYTCNVRDSIPPTIVVADRTEGETLSADYRIKVGVPTYTVSDDVTDASEIKSFVYVMYPSGLMKKVEAGKTFDTIEKGLYYVMYFAYDEFGNFATFTYKVVVS